MSPKKEETKKDAVASLEELEKTVALRPRKAKPEGTDAPKAARTDAAKPAGPAAAAPKAKPAPAAAPIKVRLVKSGICTPKDQKATLQGLGLRRLNQEVVRPDTPSIRGMLHKVRHLVEVSAAK
ncbi:MAG TPA: 50S ribosomal protein L30 [Thermoanaerobaculia bacterium]|nr:50S ribosomal protein L30 [Thermoanaerobaculia bacterium]